MPACPFGVVELSAVDGRAHKCTLCYDRLKDSLEPACAKSCPTDSIQFGEIGELQHRAENRVAELHERGVGEAYLYGAPGAPGATGGLGHLNAFFLLTDRPEVYNLPAAPTRASNRVGPSLGAGLGAVGRPDAGDDRALDERREDLPMRARAPYGREAKYAPPAPTPSKDGVTYYDQPQLKPSLYGWRVALYIFVAGLSGGSQMLAAAADLFGGERGRGIVRRGRTLALLAVAAGPGLLIADLHYPRRFYNMLRIFRPTSPMSIGTYVLSTFSLFSLVTAAAEYLGGNGGGWRAAARGAQLPAVLAGAGHDHLYRGVAGGDQHALLGRSTSPARGRVRRLGNRLRRGGAGARRTRGRRGRVGAAA